ncbi:DUF2537 domain-containing protein [Rhodococcus sp. NPDC058521]|uniref:DUF2537 domain-containing protein n=1 Tax=Rhodococcus sp. NPDC058521 TaxID=3346536 RepID=UPI00365C04D3
MQVLPNRNRVSYATSARTPWFTGVSLAVFSATFVTVAMVTFSSELARIDVPLAVLLSTVVVAGLTPTLWRLRNRPIWRWIVYGTAVGFPVAWTMVLLG